MLAQYASCYLYISYIAMGVYKQWNGMVEWKIIKVYYEFLHLNIP